MLSIVHWKLINPKFVFQYSLQQLDLQQAFPSGIDLSTFMTDYKDSCSWDIINSTAVRNAMPPDNPTMVVLGFTIEMQRYSFHAWLIIQDVLLILLKLNTDTVTILDKLNNLKKIDPNEKLAMEWKSKDFSLCQVFSQKEHKLWIVEVLFFSSDSQYHYSTCFKENVGALEKLFCGLIDFSGN